MISGARLRLARQARGFSQQQLAGMAGVSRQAVSAVESGQSDPSLRVALALAQALGMTVEELFGAEGSVPELPARLVGGQEQARGPGSDRVSLAEIGDSFVALPLAGATVSRAGFLQAGGMLTAGRGDGPPAGGRPAGAAAARPAAARSAAARPATASARGS